MWIQDKFEFSISVFSPVFLTSVFFPHPKSQMDSWIMQIIKVCRHYVYQHILPTFKYRRFNSCLKNTVYVTENSQCTYVSTDLSTHMFSILVFTSFAVTGLCIRSCNRCVCNPSTWSKRFIEYALVNLVQFVHNNICDVR